MARALEVPMGFYLHVPFCASRCGYCDFNTYTVGELSLHEDSSWSRAKPQTVTPSNFADLLGLELALAGRVLEGRFPALSTVFLGGGTPSLLAPVAVGQSIARLVNEFGLMPEAEVTIEANPDSVDDRKLSALREAGCNRLSLGMQSTSEHVLAVLERTHSLGATQRAVKAARAAGFASVSVDLIYGTPGESLDEWQQTVAEALDLGVDHVSAYALIVEPGTRLAAAVRRREIDLPDDDLMADMYLAADDLLVSSGLDWYELSNWARAGHECRHNLNYWHGHNWWGAGPGAHSHVGGVRWWNRKHPLAWAKALLDARSPAEAREVLTHQDARLERVMLQSRLATGIEIPFQSSSIARELIAEGLAQAVKTLDGRHRIVLTRRGRLLADAIVLRLS